MVEKVKRTVFSESRRRLCLSRLQPARGLVRYPLCGPYAVLPYGISKDRICYIHVHTKKSPEITTSNTLFYDIFSTKIKMCSKPSLYMAEEEESCTSAEKIKLSSIIRAIVGIVLIFGIIIFQVMLMKAINLNNWSSRSVLMVMIDFPSLLTSVIYVLPLIAISGNFKELCAACKTVFSNKKISVTKKNLYLNAVKTTMALNWFAGIVTTIIGWIGMFSNLEDADSLYPNLAVSLIPIFYSILFNLLLTIVVWQASLKNLKLIRVRS